MQNLAPYCGKWELVYRERVKDLMKNKSYETALFDLDGTLIDSGEGVTNSVAYSLKKFGIEVTDQTELYPFIGPPLHESYMRFYGFSKEKAMQAVEYYREYYREKGIYENRIYEGVEALLQRLYDKGITLIVATSKPELFARQILKQLNLADCFTCIAGANMDGTMTKKAEVISYALTAGGVSDYSKAIMIGDREYDIFGAKAAGIDALGVLYGYGGYEELKNAGADYIVEKAEEIGTVF